MSYIIFSDSIIDKTEEFFVSNNIYQIEHGIVISGKEIFDGNHKIVSQPEIYKKLREGEMISTVQGNINQMYDGFRQAVKDGNDVLYICFSSGLSGTYNTAVMVASEVTEELGGKIIVVDSRSAAAGQGILISEALEKQKAGESIEDVAKFIETERDYIHHFAIIDNLEHLKRGGRISKTSALVGGIIGIKPIVHVTEDGKLVPFTKARGMQNAVKLMAENIAKTNPDGNDVYVSHCDNLELAKEMEKAILDHTNVKTVHIAYLANTIGCHVGPDGLGIFYKGTKR